MKKTLSFLIGKGLVVFLTLVLYSGLVIALSTGGRSLQEQLYKQCGTVCSIITSILPIIAFLSLLMFLTAGLIYAAGLIRGGERGLMRVHPWSTAMLVGGIIGFALSASAHFLLEVFSQAAIAGTATPKELVIAQAGCAGTGIEKSMCKCCVMIKNIILIIIPLFMFLTAGLIYAAGLIRGEERRARANVLSTSMLVGGIIGLVFAASAHFLLETLTKAAEAVVGGTGAINELVTADYCDVSIFLSSPLQEDEWCMFCEEKELCRVCGKIKNILIIPPLLMSFTAGLIYAAGQVKGGETRGIANILSAIMLVGGFIGYILVTSVPYLLLTCMPVYF